LVLVNAHELALIGICYDGAPQAAQSTLA